jgi:hypothetical protein
MKKLLMILFPLALPLSVLAQQSNDEVAIIQTTYGIEKRKLVSDYMNIPQQQAIAFWSIYDDYEKERKDLGKERLTLIDQYAKNYATLSEDKADEIAEGVLANNLKLEKFHQAYYKKFKKATSAVTAAQFIQLELYLQSEIKREITNNIPFIGEIEKLRKN